MTMKLLLVEDDINLGEVLKEYLEKNGFELEYLRDEKEIKYIDINSYDIVILDLVLNFYKGEDLIDYIKNINKDIPIVVISAKGDISVKEICYRKGIDDYIVKPFNPKELIFKIKAIYRRIFNSGDIFLLDNIKIDLDKQKVYRDGKEMPLTNTAWKLLEFLLKNRGKIVSTESIINYVWEGKFVNPEIVRVYIKDLRDKLGSEFIRTYKGRGYSLIEDA